MAELHASGEWTLNSFEFLANTSNSNINSNNNNNNNISICIAIDDIPFDGFECAKGKTNKVKQKELLSIS